MDSLRISNDLELPLDAATRRMAILAMSGAGKSNAAVRLAEQMHCAGILSSLRRNGLLEERGSELRAGEALYIVERQ